MLVLEFPILPQDIVTTASGVFYFASLTISPQAVYCILFSLFIPHLATKDGRIKEAHVSRLGRQDSRRLPGGDRCERLTGSILHKQRLHESAKVYLHFSFVGFGGWDGCYQIPLLGFSTHVSNF